MYYNGRYYNTNSLSEAMTQDALTNHRPPRNRAEAIISAIVRHLMLSPAYLVVALASGLLVEYAIHLIAG